MWEWMYTLGKVQQRLAVEFISVYMCDQPSWKVCGTEIDEKIPLPVQHGEQILHAA